MIERALLLTLLAAPGIAGSITVESRFSAPSCRAGQDVVYILEIAWPGTATAHTIDRIDLPPFTGFTVVDRETSDAITDKGFRRRERVTLRPADAGRQIIPPARVEITSGGAKTSMASSSMTLEVGPSTARLAAIGGGIAGILALVTGLGLSVRQSRRTRCTVQPKLQDETRDFDHVMRAPNHREFFGRALELLRAGFGRRLGTELPALREAFVQSLKELGVRDAVVHLTDQVWKELDEGRFNPETPTGRDRDRVVFQIQDLFKELEGRKDRD